MTTPTSASPSLAEIAAEAGLTPIARAPKLLPYLRELWARRHFVVAFANARSVAMFSQARLGQLWQIITPLLNAGIYYMVFGLLLHTRSGVHNYVGFLIIGIFVFTYSQRSVLAGAHAISGNISLIRALHFPRAALPLAVTLIELQQLSFSMIVMLVIILATGEPITIGWLLAIPALALQSMFNVGAAMVMARVGARVPDFSQLLPFILRTWLYVSGVFYSIQAFAHKAPQLVRWALEVNPAAAYIEIVRDALLNEHDAVPSAWPVALAWAVLGLVGGFLVFFRGEVTYGRG